MMFKQLMSVYIKQKKPYSAVTVTVENLTSERYEEDDIGGIPDLAEVIKLQATGPAEAARAIRKKLKYGSVHRQLRALVILDGLIQNAGGRFQRTFADEMLLERLRVCGTSDLSDPLVREKCKELFGSWAAEFKNTRGLEQIAGLYKVCHQTSSLRQGSKILQQLPRRKQVVTQDQSKALRETEQNPFEGEEGDEDEPEAPSASHSRQSSVAQSSRTSTPPPSFFSSSASPAATKKSKKDKNSKKKSKVFDLEAEKDAMKNCIAESSVASINLLNELKSINREKERISENRTAVHSFELCKLLRRKILRYVSQRLAPTRFCTLLTSEQIQNVEAEQWLGALLYANDQLVTALMTFEQLDRSIDADSDSDDEMAEQAHLYKSEQMPLSANISSSTDTLQWLRRK